MDLNGIEPRERGARIVWDMGLLEVLCENQHEKGREKQKPAWLIVWFFTHSSPGSHEESLFEAKD